MEKLKTTEEILNKHLKINGVVIEKMFTKYLTDAMEEYANQFMIERKNEIEITKPHLPLGDVAGSLQCDRPVNALREWIHLEITERRNYTASKAYEEVLKKINTLF